MTDDASPIYGPAGLDFNPDLTFRAKARALRAELARALTARVTVDCAYPGQHAAVHTQPDERGRRRCLACHPMPEKAAQCTHNGTAPVAPPDPAR